MAEQPPPSSVSTDRTMQCDPRIDGSMIVPNQSDLFNDFNGCSFLRACVEEITEWPLCSRFRAAKRTLACDWRAETGSDGTLLRRSNSRSLPLKHLAGNHANRRLLRFQRGCHGRAPSDR